MRQKTKGGAERRRLRWLPGTAVPTVLVAGSLTRDRISSGRLSRWQAGGVVWHAATALAALGVDTRAVTRVAQTDRRLVSALRRTGVRVRVRSSKRTSVFVNRYAAGDPDLRVGLAAESLAEPIEASQLSAAVAGVDLLYLGPLHPRDIDNRALDLFDGRRWPALALDVQGYLRAVLKRRIAPALDRSCASVLELCRTVKASHEEARLLTGISDPERAISALSRRYPGLEFVVTCGTRGAYACARGRILYRPALPVEVDDVTGAGDIFFASYLSQRLTGVTAGEALGFAAAYTARRLCDPKRNFIL